MSLRNIRFLLGLGILCLLFFFYATSGFSGGADYAAVSIALKRFEQKLAADKSLEELRIQAIEVLNVET